MTDLQLVVEETVPAPRVDVFRAWTTASEVQAWWGPPGGYCSEARIDLQVGGEYLIRNELADGSTITIEGRYLEVEPPEMLRYTWATDTGQTEVEVVTVRFEEVGQSTRVVVTHDRIGSEAIVAGHTKGWLACMTGLVQHLAGPNTAA